MLYLFFLTGYDWYCFTTCLAGSSLLGMAYIVSVQASLVHSYWALFVLFRIPHWFIINEHGWFLPHCPWFALFHFNVSLVLPYLLWLALLHLMIHWFIIAGWCVIDSSLLGMACIVSLPSLVHHYCAWVVFFHVMLHWFFFTGHCLYCFTSWPTSSS